MLNPSGQYCCDAEVGSIKAGWHTCCKPAHYKGRTRSYSNTLQLHYCERHKEHFGNPTYATAASGACLEPITACPPAYVSRETIGGEMPVNLSFQIKVF